MRRLGALVLLGLSSCGTIVGAVPFVGPGQERTVVSLEAGRDVRFWSDFSATYERWGEIDEDDVAYEVELFQDGAIVANLRCAPRDYGLVRLCHERFHGIHSYAGNCRMACVARVPKSGPTEVRVTFSAPPSMHIERAHLIVRQ
ncbi:MAG TPA: hypothetical protein VHL80_00550 [Polyangia bacterium]|nr:hypothetical protein [Polyangia bacterium]